MVFTAASAWRGLSGAITTLIVARVVQGLGAALMTPQTMAVITRIFPPDRRGGAMGLWGAVAGVATLVGPIPGVVLSAVGMLLLVFGIQEGASYDWDTIAGPSSVWSLMSRVSSR